MSLWDIDMANSKKRYLDMTDDELLSEITKIQKIVKDSKSIIAKKQNRIYLVKLHSEWGRRKHERTTKERF